MTEKRNIHALIEKEAPSLNNLLDPEDVKEFKAMTAELRDTCIFLFSVIVIPFVD